MSEIVSLSIAPVEEVSVESTNDSEYDRFLSDLWVAILLAFMVLSCIGCLCTCFLVHAFRQWQQRVMESRRMEAQVESGYDSESLPSYTVVAGLPTYEEAIEQLKQGIAQGSHSPPSTDTVFSRLSVGDLLEVYKVDVKK